MIIENTNQNSTMNKDDKLKDNNKDKQSSFESKKDIGTSRRAEEPVVKPHDSPMKSTEKTSPQSNRL